MVPEKPIQDIFQIYIDFFQIYTYIFFRVLLKWSTNYVYVTVVRGLASQNSCGSLTAHGAPDVRIDLSCRVHLCVKCTL